MSCDLYRYFDKDSNLLYVGISLNSVARMAQHRAASHWYESALEVKIERFETRSEAAEAEINAIKNEKPIHNIVHNNSVDTEKLADETEAEDRARESSVRLVRFITYRPLYTLRETADLLFPKSARTVKLVRSLIENGELRGIFKSSSDRRDKFGRDYTLNDYWITGWAIIDFIEALENGEAKING